MAAIRLDNMFFAKAFKAEEGSALAAEIAKEMPLGGRRVVIIDHPPTAGLVPLIRALRDEGAQVFLRDHHADADRDGSVVAECRQILDGTDYPVNERAVIVTRAEHPACSTLVEAGEFRDDVIIADADQDGVTAALKAAGVSYPELDADAVVLDGPQTGKTAENLSLLGLLFVRAWGAIPPFGSGPRESVFRQVVGAFSIAVSGHDAGYDELARLAAEYERKVANAKSLAAKAEMLSPQIRFVDASGATDFDPPTLAAELDKGVAVSARKVSTGPIAGKPGGFGAQISLARTKQGETAGIDLAKLVPADWARGPEHGVISNTPFLLHLSPEKWEAFRPILLSAVAG